MSVLKRLPRAYRPTAVYSHSSYTLDGLCHHVPAGGNIDDFIDECYAHAQWVRVIRSTMGAHAMGVCDACRQAHSPVIDATWYRRRKLPIGPPAPRKRRTDA